MPRTETPLDVQAAVGIWSKKGAVFGVLGAAFALCGLIAGSVAAYTDRDCSDEIQRLEQQFGDRIAALEVENERCEERIDHWIEYLERKLEVDHIDAAHPPMLPARTTGQISLTDEGARR